MLRSMGGIGFDSKVVRRGVVASDAELGLGSMRCNGGFVVVLSELGLVLTFSFDSLLSSGRGNGLAFDLISVLSRTQTHTYFG